MQHRRIPPARPSIHYEIFNDKFPVYPLEIPKRETSRAQTVRMINALETEGEEHPVARFIAVFNHYADVKALEKGEIDLSILNSKRILFRTNAVNKPEDRSVSHFMEAPTNTMIGWVGSLSNR